MSDKNRGSNKKKGKTFRPENNNQRILEKDKKERYRERMRERSKVKDNVARENLEIAQFVID